MEEEVLHAARNEGRLALLVYASKRAVEMNTIPTDGNKRTSLPAALEVSNPSTSSNPFNPLIFWKALPAADNCGY